jgi:hypothetical protein
MARSAFPASVGHRRGSRIGLLVALPALLAQVLIAAPHAAERAMAVRAASGRDIGREVSLRADLGRPAGFHDPAQCPTCQAAAQGRTALGAGSGVRALPLPPTLEVVSRASTEIASALARSTVSPRAPPA